MANINNILRQGLSCNHEINMPEPFQCDIIINLIVDALKSNIQINAQQLVLYLDRLFPTYNNRHPSCTIHNSQKIKELLNTILTIIQISKKCWHVSKYRIQ